MHIVSRLKVYLRGYRPTMLRGRGLADRLRGMTSALRVWRNHKRLFALNIVRRDRKVVFVSERPGWREAKIAFGLRRAGWDVIQIYRQRPSFSDFSDFSDAQQYAAPWDGVDLAHRSRARLFHVFTPTCDVTSLLVTKHKPGRVVVDIWDYFYSVADGLPDMTRKYAVDIAAQSRCLAQADAVCCRDLQIQYRRNETRIARGKPLIYFPEYCWNRQDLPEPRRDGEIRLVQIGWMGLEKRGDADVGAYQVYKALIEAGCHVHIFLHPSFPAAGMADYEYLFSDYLELGAKTGRLHINATVAAQRVVEEIMHFDYGLGVMNGLTYGMPFASHNEARMPYCGSGRFFDYLDAGLGIISHHSLKFSFRNFSPYGLTQDVNQLFRNGRIVEALRQRPPRDRVLAARQALSLDRNIGRLTRFYEALV